MKGTPTKQQERFADLVEKSLGLQTRRYDNGHIRLHNAADLLWEHLCTLDEKSLNHCKEITLFQLATAYAKVRGKGWRQFHNERTKRNGEQHGTI